MNLAFAATADRPTAVLTGPSIIAGSRPRLIRLPRPAVTHEMVRVILEHRPLTATAALVWNGDLPRTLQQILFDTAESITSPGPARQVEPELKAMSLPVTYLGQALSACVHRRGSHQPTGVRVPLAPSSGARLPAGNRRLRAASASAQAARWSSRNCGRTASARKGARPYGRWADCSLICRLSATTPGATCVATSTVASIVSRRSGRMFAELERPL